MNLVDKQSEFTKSLSRLLTWLEINGYQVTLGEAYRPEWVAKTYQLMSSGIANSLHTKRLAIDLNLFFNGALLMTASDYQRAGEFWESLSVPGLEHAWGGRFTPVDAEHFSIEHEGVR